jgi:hypothetical protein
VTDLGEALAPCTLAKNGRRSGLIPASPKHLKLANVREPLLYPHAPDRAYWIL